MTNKEKFLAGKHFKLSNHFARCSKEQDCVFLYRFDIPLIAFFINAINEDCVIVDGVVLGNKVNFKLPFDRMNFDENNKI